MDQQKRLSKIDPKRRNFLRAAGGAGALATLASVAGEGAAAPVAAAPAAAPEVKAAGYRETEHIREYYRTAAYW
ncbi:MAG: twin-arginine translocation signal domain-containing protein [Massilia sp.]